MVRRRLALLLLLYVSLDFANPLMPGAVSFDPSDSVDGLRASEMRVASPATVPAPPRLEFLPERPSPRAPAAAEERRGPDLRPRPRGPVLTADADVGDDH